MEHSASETLVILAGPNRVEFKLPPIGIPDRQGDVFLPGSELAIRIAGTNAPAKLVAHEDGTWRLVTLDITTPDTPHEDT